MSLIPKNWLFYADAPRGFVNATDDSGRLVATIILTWKVPAFYNNP